MNVKKKEDFLCILFDNKYYMISIYAFSLAFVIVLIINFIKAIKQKDYLGLIISILMFIFIVVEVVERHIVSLVCP